MKPQIVIEKIEGFHNQKPKDLIIKGNSYKDLSTICIIPSRGTVPIKVVTSWWNLMPAMNQQFMRMPIIGMEVGEAYSQGIETILGHPELSKWKYILTLEEDNCPPPDGLLKLYENIEKYDAVGGLYWTKGVDGKPMCYGDPKAIPVSFSPFMPDPDSVIPCRGLGMGFTLFRLEMFKDKRLPKPLFKTVQTYKEGVGAQSYTQDLKFFEEAGKLGYKFACDARVKVGHYSVQDDIMW